MPALRDGTVFTVAAPTVKTGLFVTGRNLSIEGTELSVDI